MIGTTAGRGHSAPTIAQTRLAKQMLGLPLHRKFRELLGAYPVRIDTVVRTFGPGLGAEYGRCYLLRMARGLIFLLLVAGIAFLASPFVVTSLALDNRGVAIPGRIHYKRENIRVRYSGWGRTADATIEYTIPETGEVTFFDVHPSLQQYDAMHINQPVQLRYLMRDAVPAWPMTGVLWAMHALPTVRLINPQVISLLEIMSTPGVVRGIEILSGLLTLYILWRITRRKLLAWLVAAGVIGALSMFVYSFPHPAPPPLVDVRRGVGTIVTINRITRLFSGPRQRGSIAAQPVDVVGVEIVAEEMVEPVLAIDLIDSGSVPGLREKSTVPVTYEAQSPRTAYIDGGSRTFAGRNIRGAVLDGFLNATVLLGGVAVALCIGKVFKRLTSR
jgi:hypothetical protein